jgi:hypothetical protein
MADATLIQARLLTIETERANAARLISLVSHESMKTQVRLAIRDLEEAVLWLHQKDLGAAGLIVIDVILMLARARLTMVDAALTAHGPDAMLIG